jgi:hypothetical protein
VGRLRLFFGEAQGLLGLLLLNKRLLLCVGPARAFCRQVAFANQPGLGQTLHHQRDENHPEGNEQH